MQMTQTRTSEPRGNRRPPAPHGQPGAARAGIPTRRLSLDDDFRTVPKHFAARGDPIVSHVCAALSGVFPDGEDFFVRSVRNFRDRVEEPELKAQVAGFIGQEAMHGRQHRAFNHRLAELGYPTKRLEQQVGRMLAVQDRFFPPEHNLALTAALEHFTATMAEMLLTNEEARRELGYPAVRELFVWHALEESEHKAVAFDVFEAVSGRRWVRTWTMRWLLVTFPLFMAAAVGRALLADRHARSHPVMLARSLVRFRHHPLMSRELRAQLRDYLRPDFHPSDSDTSALVEAWREELFGDGGSLSAKLAG
jgi:predicted metal-dependent hydrolase